MFRRRLRIYKVEVQLEMRPFLYRVSIPSPVAPGLTRPQSPPSFHFPLRPVQHVIIRFITYNDLVMEVGMARGPSALRGTKIRLKSASAVGFGMSWDISSAERDAVRGFLTFLEDRRAFYAIPSSRCHEEVDGEVERSVNDVRKQCTATLAALPEKSVADDPIRAIRRACREFLDICHNEFRNPISYDQEQRRRLSKAL